MVECNDEFPKVGRVWLQQIMHDPNNPPDKQNVIGRTIEIDLTKDVESGKPEITFIDYAPGIKKQRKIQSN